jgi:hypothetical protein
MKLVRLREVHWKLPKLVLEQRMMKLTVNRFRTSLMILLWFSLRAFRQAVL